MTTFALTNAEEWAAHATTAPLNEDRGDGTCRVRVEADRGGGRGDDHALPEPHGTIAGEIACSVGQGPSEDPDGREKVPRADIHIVNEGDPVEVRAARACPHEHDG